jgi:hypothetical protein
MGPAGGRDAAWVSPAGSTASAALVIGYPPERTERVGSLSIQPLARGGSWYFRLSGGPYGAGRGFSAS